ncbi:ubiquitin-like modifier-activating enzyme ATG7 [Schistocerca cancellata]|uniref:ubiquitin-like modifier-activating enzyme ATG7 n=1 Tax=Schistocerca cancellata TaxID=274614 RepID=UPI0021184FF6|nr:ubiquitin-like modifier-activating enzyme ATG7 [Schistocerca cancellata]
MSQKKDRDVLLYAPFESFVHTTFWHKLSQIKLEIDKLKEEARPVWGCYTCTTPPAMCSVHVDFSSYNQDFQDQPLALPMHGTIINKNTLESFKEYNKVQLLDEYGQNLLSSIRTAEALKNPSLLSRFILLTYADLKKYHFYYWFAFPAINLPSIKLFRPPRKLNTLFSGDQMQQLLDAYTNIKDWKQRPFFLVQVQSGKVSILPLCDIDLLKQECHIENENNITNGLYLGFADPSVLPANPGWPLRNLLALVIYHCKEILGKPLQLIALRLQKCGDGQSWSAFSSLVLNIELPTEDNVPPKITPSWIGWQRNEKGKFGPRLAKLSASMDPAKLAETSVQLNLKLMKWRLVPNLDLDVVRQTRCLLLGAGTLGCAVARTLLAWGVHTITFVDSGTVSFSNPVRQSLYKYEDCLHGGHPKAVAAAESLKTIFPGVNASGYQLHMPMPGHTVGEVMLPEVQKAVLKLEQLIENHDVIFLLTDSRESRWLPTVIATSKEKLVMTAALGFDTFVVMRHGMRNQKKDVAVAPDGPQLGCYFCSDVLAPGNSQVDRTLDQQCTVTRPGVSAVAAALAAELLVSVLQHPLRGHAPAEGVLDSNKTPSYDSQCPLGIVPHSIRGFLSSYEQLICVSHAFQNCTACSKMVIQEYQQQGFAFLMAAFNNPHHLEDLTGLTEIHQKSEDAEVWELSDMSDTE